MTQVADEIIVPAAPVAGPILNAQGIRKMFRMGDSRVEILKGADFTLSAGEFVAIEGRSGSGKSTLLHILGALESVDAGSLEFDQQDYTTRVHARPRWYLPGSWTLGQRAQGLMALTFVLMLATAGAFPLRAAYHTAKTGFVIGLMATAVSLIAAVFTALLYQKREKPRALLRNRQFGFVFQFYHLLPELNVLENAMLAPKIELSWWGYRKQKAVLRERAIALLEQLGMGHRLKHRPNHLSGGERQRVAIARALMNSPRVLFADEPTGNLDADTGLQIMSVLESLHRDHGQTIVMVTHDRMVARQADRVLVLRDGKLETASSANRT